MPRQAKPWYRESKGAWYIKVNGKQVSLGVSGNGKGKRREAVKAWHKLIAEGRKPKPESMPEPTPAVTVQPSPCLPYPTSVY